MFLNDFIIDKQYYTEMLFEKRKFNFFDTKYEKTQLVGEMTAK